MVDSETLGGAKMHASVSGTIDYREPNDDACITRLKRLIDALPAHPSASSGIASPSVASDGDFSPFTQNEYDVRDLLKLILDDAPFDEYKADYGQTLVCGIGKLGGHSIGVVANQKKRVKPAEGRRNSAV